jgi:S-adenosylmethionine/arginine decarboxylase-like enzyme
MAIKAPSTIGGPAAQAHRSRVTFGWELILDLYECAPEPMRSKEAICRFARELCAVIKMVPYGEPLAPYFGEKQEHTKGYSLLQFIETSSITGHFSEGTNCVYLNIFSCKRYDEKAAEEFARNFFGAQRVVARFLTRE